MSHVPNQPDRSPPVSQPDERIVELQEVLTHQQRLLQQLSDVVAHQSDEVRALRRELDAFRQHVRQLTEDLASGHAEGSITPSDSTNG